MRTCKQAGLFPLCPNRVKNFYSYYKPENVHAKWVKHADFNGTIVENISNSKSLQTGTRFVLCPNMVKKVLETWKLAWGLWFTIRLHNFYFKTPSQSKGSYQLLMEFMLLKSQLSSKTSLGKYRTSRHSG